MGLFGKKFDFDKFQAGITAAQASLAGDYGSAAQAWGGFAKAKKDRERQRLLHATIDADETLPQQAREYAKLFPESYVPHYFRHLYSGRSGGGGPATGDAGVGSPAPRGSNETLGLGSAGAGSSEQDWSISLSGLGRYGRRGLAGGLAGTSPAVLSDRDILEHDAGVGPGHRRPASFFGRRFPGPI